MALLSELVSICAAHRLDTEATLSLFARELREAGRISKAGRGRGAARMTFLDGARFLIACAATDHPKRASDAEAVFSGTVFHYGTEKVGGNARSEISNFVEGSTLDLGLANVLQAIADGSLDQEERNALDARQLPAHLVFAHVSLDVFRSGASCVLRAGPRDLKYMHPAAIELMAAKHDDTMQAIAKSWERETERFRNGKNLHASLDGKLLRAVARAIAGSDQ